MKIYWPQLNTIFTTTTIRTVTKMLTTITTTSKQFGSDIIEIRLVLMVS